SPAWGTPTELLTHHLKAAHGFKGRRNVLDGRFLVPGRPGHNQNIETGGPVQETMHLEIVQGEISETLLLGVIDRRGGLLAGIGLRRADFDKNDGADIDGHDVDFAVDTSEIASQDAIAQTLEESCRRPFRAGAEPAPPPWLARRLRRHNRASNTAGLGWKSTPDQLRG